MPTYHRYYVPDALVFITAVTERRLPIFHANADRQLLLDTLRAVQALHPFRALAYAILPDHLHLLLRYDGQDNFSVIVHSLKRGYTANYKRAHAITSPLRLWQPRFWDHLIRDERDLARHLDYIHWNPVKHGCVTRPEDWAHSTYRRWLERGYYEPGWGHIEEPEGLKNLIIPEEEPSPL